MWSGFRRVKANVMANWFVQPCWPALGAAGPMPRQPWLPTSRLGWDLTTKPLKNGWLFVIVAELLPFLGNAFTPARASRLTTESESSHWPQSRDDAIEHPERFEGQALNSRRSR